MRIYPQKGGTLNEADRLELAKLLIKAGYRVNLGKEKQSGSNIYTHYVEFEELKHGSASK